MIVFMTILNMLLKYLFIKFKNDLLFLKFYCIIIIRSETYNFVIQRVAVALNLVFNYSREQNANQRKDESIKLMKLLFYYYPNGCTFILRAINH